MNLRRKFLLALGLLAAGPLGVVILILRFALAPQAERMIGERLQDNVAQTARTMDEFIVTCVRDLKALAESPELTGDSPAAISARLAHHNAAYPYFRRVLLTDTNAVIVGSSAAADTGKLLFDLRHSMQDDFRAVLERPPGPVQVSDLSDVAAAAPAASTRGEAASARADLVLLLRVQDEEARPRGVLVGVLETQHLLEYLEDIRRRTPGGEPACLLDSQGHLLLCTDPAATPFVTMCSGVVGARRQQETKLSSGWGTGFDPRGRRVTAGFATTAGFGANEAGRWLVVAAAPYTVIMEPVTSLIVRVGALLAATLALAVGAGWVLARSIVQPIESLAGAAARFGRGELATRLPVGRRDEVGQLAAAFNQMAEAVQQSHAGLEQRVNERTSQLGAVAQELESASYTISHDLRAPLRHIQGYVELLKREAGDRLADKDRRRLDTIADAGREMGLLVDGLLSFIRLGRADFSEIPLDLDRLAHECIYGLESAIGDRPILWQIPALPPVSGDPGLLRQVLANLLGNAVKYTRPRDPARIELGCAGEEAGRLIFFVRDNGVGFDPQYAHKLFGVFQRLHRADEFEGTGIGLANVRRIIVRHGGRVWAEGKVNEGATVFFTLAPAIPPPENAENADNAKNVGE